MRRAFLIIASGFLWQCTAGTPTVLDSATSDGRPPVDSVVDAPEAAVNDTIIDTIIAATASDLGTDGNAAKGIPFGFWGLNGYHSPTGFADLKLRFGINLFQATSTNPAWTVGTFLPMIKGAGMKVTLSMTGYHDNYTTDTNFDLTKWKTTLDNWKNSGVAAFVSDGTLIGHMLIDDLTEFPGTGPSAADLDEMARHSKDVIPGLMTYVRRHATGLPTPSAGTYQHLDACLNQYHISNGDIYSYATAQRDRALQLGLGVINGLNICDGGDGSSGKTGWRAPTATRTFWAMSAAEITTKGTALLAIAECGMFLTWEYDAEEVWYSDNVTIGADYFDQPALQNALAGLATLASQHPAVVLLKP